MKRPLARLAVALVLLAGLAGCGGRTPDTGMGTSSDTTASAPVTYTGKVTQTGTMVGWSSFAFNTFSIDSFDHPFVCNFSPDCTTLQEGQSVSVTAVKFLFNKPNLSKHDGSYINEEMYEATKIMVTK